VAQYHIFANFSLVAGGQSRRRQIAAMRRNPLPGDDPVYHLLGITLTASASLAG